MFKRGFEYSTAADRSPSFWSSFEGVQAASPPGTWRTVVSTPARSRDGVIMGSLEIADDHAGAALRRPADESAAMTALRSELERALKGRQECQRLMIAAGHDLMQPLQIVQIMLARHARAATEKEAAEWSRIAAEQIRRLADGLHYLAAAAFMDIERLAPTPQPICASQLMEWAITRWTHQVVRQAARFKHVPCSVFVHTDPRLLATILDNLIGNALKYTRDGGVLLGCRRRGAHLAIEIVDSGPGMAREDLRRIFEPFQRGDTRSGMGLGLWIVRETASLLGHEIKVESMPGHGTRFAVLLPRI